MARGEVKKPGSRGGKYYFDAGGRIHYGTQPTKKRAARRPEIVKQKKVERKQERQAKGLTAAHHKAAKTFQANYPTMRAKVLAHVGKFIRDATIKVFHAALTVAKTWEAFEQHLHKLRLNPEHVVLHALVHVPHLVDLVSAGVAMAEPLLRSQEPGVVVGLDLLERDYPLHRLRLIHALDGSEAADFTKAVRMCPTWEELDRMTGGAMQAAQVVLCEVPAALDAITKSLTGQSRYIQAPGSRGGRYHWTQTGNVRYGEAPEGFRAHLEHVRERQAARKAHVEATAAAAVAAGGVVRLPGDRWALLTRNTHPDSKPFRATLFDAHGVDSHDVGDTPEAALYAATEYISDWPDMQASTPAAFEEFASRPSFTEGNRRTLLNQQASRIDWEASKRKQSALHDIAHEARGLVALDKLDEAERLTLTTLASLRTLVQKALYALPWVKARTLAPGQINLFGGREVQHPGIRGGDYWYDERGQVRYGPRPKPDVPTQKVQEEPEPVPVPSEKVQEEPTIEGALKELAALEEERKMVPHTPLERLQRVMRRFDMGVKEGMTNGGNPCLNIYSTKRVSRAVFDARNALFQALKAERVVWGWKQGVEFYWSTKDDRVDRVIEIFGGEHGGERDSAVARPAGPAAGGVGVESGRHILPGGGDVGVGPGPQRDPGGSLPEGAGIVSGGEDRRRGDVAIGTQVPAAILGEGPSDRLIADLAAVQPPEPTLDFPALLLDQLAATGAMITPANQRDVCRIVEAYQRGDKAYLAGNGTGTGKTFLGLGALWMTRPREALIVVPNQGVADQWKEDGKKFGLEIKDALGAKPREEGIFVCTYAGLRTGKIATTGWQMSIFDEVHREGTKLFEGRATAKLVNRVAMASKFTVFASATPFERPQECSYLFDLLLFDDEGFQPWSIKHGVQWQDRTVYTKGGGQTVVQVPKFVGSSKEKDAKVLDMLRIRADIVGQGRGVFREIEVTEPLTIDFEHVPIEGEHAETVHRALDAMKTLPDEPVFRMQKINMAKRLLDYVKIEKAVDLAEHAVREGKRVALFISNVSPFRFDKISDEELRAVDEEGRPLVPYVRRMIQETWNLSGLSRDVKSLPSPTEQLVTRLRQRLGETQVADYTGKVTEARRKKTKALFQKGELPVIVATIAAGGTGLSLHDTHGDAPRYQINVGLPWTGKELQQMIGRTYRVGVRSPVNQAFLLTPHPDEQHVAKVVAGKLQSMRAGVNGITADTNVAHLVRFTLEVTDEDDDEGGDLEKAVHAWAELAFGLANGQRYGTFVNDDGVLILRAQPALFPETPSAHDRWFLKCPVCKKPFAVETEHDVGETVEALAKVMKCPKCGHAPEQGASVEVYVWQGAAAPQRTWKFKTQGEADKFATQLRDQIQNRGWTHNVRVHSDMGQMHRVMGRVKEHAPNRDIPCNAACFYAPGPNCECSCGGANHGKGHVVHFLAPLNPEPIQKAEDPEQPGIRGGQYYRTDTGRIRYGVRHEPLNVHDLLAHAQESKRKLWQVGTCRQCGRAVMMHWSPAAVRQCPGCGGTVTVEAGRVGMREEEAEQRVGTYAQVSTIQHMDAVLRTTQEEPAVPLQWRLALRYDPERDVFTYHDESGDNDVPADRLGPIVAQSKLMESAVQRARATPHKWHLITKAQQLGLMFGPRQDPEQPGVRGGKYYRTETGHVRYGERPFRGLSHTELDRAAVEGDEDDRRFAVDEREARRQGPEDEYKGEKSPVTPDKNKWTRERPSDQVRVGGLGILGSMPSRASKRGRWLVYTYGEGVGDRATQEYSRGWIKDNGKAFIASLMANEHPGKILDDKGTVVAENEAWRMRHAGTRGAIPTQGGWVGTYTDRSGRTWYSRERFARSDYARDATNALMLELDGPPPETAFEREQRETQAAIVASKAGGAQHLDQIEPVVGMRVRDILDGDVGPSTLGTITTVEPHNPKLYGPDKRFGVYVRWDGDPSERSVELSHTVLVEGVAEPPREYEYSLRNRPYQTATVPRPKDVVGTGTHPKFKFGTVRYTEALSSEDVASYELNYIPTPPEMDKWVDDFIAWMPNREEYVEELGDEMVRRELAQSVGRRLDRQNWYGDRDEVTARVIQRLTPVTKAKPPAKPETGRFARGETGQNLEQPSERFATVHGPDPKGNPSMHHIRVVKGDKPGVMHVASEHRGRARGALTGQIEAVPIEQLCEQFECTPSPDLGMPVPSDVESVREAIVKAGEKITKDLKLPAGEKQDKNETNETLPEEAAEDHHNLSPLVNRLLRTVASQSGGEVQNEMVVVDRPDQLQPAVEAMMRETSAAGGTIAIDNGFLEPDEMGFCALQCRVNLVSGTSRDTEIPVAITLRSMAGVKEKLEDLREKMEASAVDPEQAAAAGALLSLSALTPFV